MKGRIIEFSTDNENYDTILLEHTRTLFCEWNNRITVEVEAPQSGFLIQGVPNYLRYIPLTVDDVLRFNGLVFELNAFYRYMPKKPVILLSLRSLLSICLQMSVLMIALYKVSSTRFFGVWAMLFVLWGFYLLVNEMGWDSINHNSENKVLYEQLVGIQFFNENENLYIKKQDVQGFLGNFKELKGEF